MRKVFMMTVLALAVSGCASQQSNTPQVRDLSDARRAVEVAILSGPDVKKPRRLETQACNLRVHARRRRDFAGERR